MTMEKNLMRRVYEGIKRPAFRFIAMTFLTIATLPYLCGCETTPPQNMAISGSSAKFIAATDSSLSLQQGQALDAMGGLLEVLAQQEAMKEAAREAKSEVNVNINSADADLKLEDYGNGWRESALLPNLMVNNKTKSYAPKPGYVWEKPFDDFNFNVKFTERTNIKDDEIKPKYNEARFGPK